MKEKLEILMADTGLRVGEIAAKLGVKAPVISHILSGRNQPNFVLTSKIISTFKEYNPYWWLGTSDVKLVTAPTPSSTMQSQSNSNIGVDSSSSNFNQSSSSNSQIEKQPTAREPQLFDSLPDATISAVATTHHDATQVERIVVFYSDNSFESFTPRKK